MAKINRGRVLRDALYARSARLAVRHLETDRLVRNLMAAALAEGESLGPTLAQDLSVLRWALKKIEENRRDAELGRVIREVTP